MTLLTDILNLLPTVAAMGTACLVKRSSYASVLCVWTTLGLGCLTAAQAQVNPDTTLGNESSVIVEDSVVRGLPANLIEGGAVRGSNIFHSFTDFNIAELQRVYFANPAGTENILSRVTGNNPSDLLGTLGVDGNANLFFLNPNGITFGPDSQLDITGSFFASTAESFNFGNGLLYGVTDTSVPPLLEVTLTPGLQYGANQRAIENTGNLSVGENFTLDSDTLDLSGELTAGSNLTLQAQDTVQIRDSAEQPFIAAAGDELLVQGNELVDIFALNHPDSGLFAQGNIVLRSPSSVIGDTHYYSGGSFSIEQPDGALGNLISPNDPLIIASGDVFLAGYQGNSLHVLAGGSITIRDFVWIQGAEQVNGIENEALQLRNAEITVGGQQIAPVIDGQQNVPTLDIRAGIDPAELPEGNTRIGRFFPSQPDFNDIDPTPSANIEVGTIFFADASSSLEPDGNIPIAGVISLTNRYKPNTAPAEQASIDIRTVQTLPLLANRSIINGDFRGGGYIEIQSRGDITIDGVVEAYPPPFFDGFADRIFGNGGDISLIAEGDITLSQGALLNSFGLQGGNILIDSGGTFSASGPALLDQSVSGIISTSIGTDPSLKGGEVDITANSVIFTDSAFIFTDTGIAASENAPAIGAVEGGDIFIRTQDLQLRGGSEISAGTYANGDPGIIVIDALDDLSAAKVTLDGVAEITLNADGSYNSGGFSSGLFSNVEQGATGNSRLIQVNTGTLNILNGAVISSRTRGDGDAGIIDIDVDNLVIRDGGQIMATTFGSGRAGDMLINASNFIDISDIDLNYDDRFNQLYALKYQDFLAQGQSSVEANINAFEFARTIIDPVSLASGLQASDVIDYFQSTNNDGSTSFLPDINGEGKPGNIFISSPVVTLRNGAEINTSNFGREGGSDPNGNIDGGLISIETNELSLLEGGRAIAQTYGTGPGSFILIQPLNDNPSRVNISGTAPITILGSGRPIGGYSSGLVTSTENSDIFLLGDPNYPLNILPQVTGAGGDIIIQDVDTVSISRGGVLNARSRSEGTAGDIAILEATEIDITDGGEIITAAYRGGEAGTIFLESTGSIDVIGADLTYEDRLNSFEAEYIDYLKTLFTGFFALDNSEAQEQAEQRAFLARQFFIDPLSAVSGLQAQAGLESTGGGNILVSSNGGLRLIDGGQVSSETFGRGDAGDIDINVVEEIELSGAQAVFSQGNDFNLSSAILSQVAAGAGSSTNLVEGGSITLRGNSLKVDNQGTIASGTFGFGSPGNIIIDIEDSISMDNLSSIRSLIEQGGNALGDQFQGQDLQDRLQNLVDDDQEVLIQTRSLDLLNGSQVVAGIFREGNNLQGGIGAGGDIQINATDRVLISGQSDQQLDVNDPLNPEQTLQTIGFSSGVKVDTEAGATGPAGGITILTDTMIIDDKGEVTAVTANSSNAGGVELQIGTLLSVSNGGLISVDGSLNTDSDPGEPGSIVIQPLNLETPVNELLDFETGDQVPYLGGAPSIELSEGGKIQARTNSTDSANITIIGDSLSLEGTRILPLDTDNTCPTCNDISASAEGNNATGGNIFLRLNAISADRDDSSDIAANAAGEGGGGRIQLLLPTDAAGRTPFDLNAMFRLEEGRSIESDLDASSELGIQGSVEVGETAVVESVDVPLPLDPTTLVNRSCELQASESASEFRVVGRGGLPTTPEETLNEEPLLEDLGPAIEDGVTYPITESTQTTVSHGTDSIENISEPQGWRRTPDGRLVLYSAASSTNSPVQLDTSCASASEQGRQTSSL